MERLAPKHGTPSDFTSQISLSKLWHRPCTSGSFGVVYQYTINTSEGTKEVAVKVFNVNLGRAVEKCEKAMRRELEVWLKLSNHRTIVPLLGTADVGFPLPALVSQWMPSGTLYMYLEQSDMVTTSAKVELVMSVANGLNYLHSEYVVHGDLHPANVLIDESGNPRLTDFGLATVVGDAELQLNTTTAGLNLNPQWRAPEVIGIHSDDEDPVRPNFKSDVYSFGGVMFFIISGHTPWKEKRNPHQIIAELLKRATPARPNNIPDNYWNLIQQCWSWEPRHRPEVTKVIGSLATKTTAMLVKTESTIRTTMSHSTTQTIHPEAAARTCFDHRGNDEDLDQAIALDRGALALHPVGHPERSKSLNNLAVHLSTRFDHQGNGEDLDQAIALDREVLALHPVGHLDRFKSLNNLANRLFTRFDHRGNDEDLDQAIVFDREALDLCPVGHTDRPISLNNLAIRLSAHFHHRGNGKDLDQAISLHRVALALRPVGRKDRSILLNSLASELSTRFDRRGNVIDLDQAIACYREALALYPVGHPERSSSLVNLANILSTHFHHRGNAEDLNESRENLRCALTLLTQHDPRRLMVHRSLATLYLLFHRSGLGGADPGENIDSLDVAMHHFKAAANFVPGGLLYRLRASLSWVRHADLLRHSTELEAYATSMQLMDAYMSATASVSSRHNAMQDFPSTLAVDAASCALRSGDVRHAVELLEQGRAIIWTQMIQFRTPLDSLQTYSNHAAALVKRFRDLSSLLDRPLASHAYGTQIVDVEADDIRYRRLVEDWNRVVEEIRKFEGFSRFLLPPMFADLQEAARDGPIIMLIASKSSCDAIIIKHTQPPASIQLPTDLEKLTTLVLVLREAIGKEAGPKGNQTALIKALRKLWGDVVHPVVENLGGFAQRGSRIWWCPTLLFNFLPLHAAGEYRANVKSLSQQYISSYTPSLTALMRARRSHDRSPSVPFAAIGQNCPAGASFNLDYVEPELDLVRSLLPPPPTVSFTKITSVDATKSKALRALRDNTWLHFSCHGTENFDDPVKSAFLMRDQPLSLLDITQMDLSLHQFGFFPACETSAVGVFATPDEVIHLAAGLQFAGVKSVVGRLWGVNDQTVQRLVEAFYKNLCGDGTMNSKRAARALHQAVHSLARDSDMPVDQRIAFMHIGI